MQTMVDKSAQKPQAFLASETPALKLCLLLSCLLNWTMVLFKLPVVWLELHKYMTTASLVSFIYLNNLHWKSLIYRFELKVSSSTLYSTKPHTLPGAHFHSSPEFTFLPVAMRRLTPALALCRLTPFKSRYRWDMLILAFLSWNRLRNDHFPWAFLLSKQTSNRERKTSARAKNAQTAKWNGPDQITIQRANGLKPPVAIVKWPEFTLLCYGYGLQQLTPTTALSPALPIR